MGRKISFVIPCYNSEQTIGEVVEEINCAMQINGESYEIVLVNDSSEDNTMGVIKKLCDRYNNIVGVNLVKNFGQHAALMAGFHYVNGDVIVCMDDDGQTPAKEVDKLLEKIDAGHDVVYARYPVKRHSFYRNWGSKFNDLMARIMLNKPKNLYLSSYFAIKRFLVDEIIQYMNPYPYVIGLVLRSTQNIVNVDVEHRERKTGVSGYTMKKLVSLWMNGFTAFSVKPLRVATVCGGITAFLGFAYGVITIIRKIIGLNYVLGYSGLMSALMFIGGLILLMLGITGEYIGRIYISLNRAPQYIVREILNGK